MTKLLTKCTYSGCGKLFYPSNNVAKFCTKECRELHYKRHLTYRAIPFTCMLAECNNPINNGPLKAKPKKYCCPEHRWIDSKRMTTPSGGSRATRVNNNKSTICEYGDCDNEFIKTKSSHKFCCSECQKLHNKDKALKKNKIATVEESYRTLCYWSGEYFETNKKKTNFKNGVAKSFFYRMGYTLSSCSVEQEFRDEDYSSSDMAKEIFLHCDFINCRFENTLLNGARFIGCTFKDCDFTGAFMLDTLIEDVMLRGTNIFERVRVNKHPKIDQAITLIEPQQIKHKRR